MGRLGGALAIFLCGFLIAGPGGALAVEPGEVDRSFGENGLVVQPSPRFSSGDFFGPFGEDMAVGPEDAIFLLQSYRSCGKETCTVELFVQRYTPDGVLDAGFGEGGTSSKVAVAAPSDPRRYRGGGTYGSLAVNPLGEPVVAAGGDRGVTLFRLDRAGSLAGDFGGGDGLVAADLGVVVTKPHLAIARDGRIVVTTGLRRGSSARSFVILARYTPNGDHDRSFGAGTPESRSGGWMTIRGWQPAALALTRAGGVVLAGAKCCPPITEAPVYVGRRGSNGRPLPPSTPRAPWRYLKVGGNARVTSVVALPRGKVYLVGSSYGGPFAARLLPSGRLDPSFGRSGMVRPRQMVRGVAPAVVDRAGRLYVPGAWSREVYEGNRALLARLTGKGRLDRGWGDSPRGYALLPERIEDAVSLDFQSSGRIVVFGEYTGGCVRSCPLPARTLTRLLTGSTAAKGGS